MNYSVCFSHTIILVTRKLGINKGKSNKAHSVTKQCYVTHYEKKTGISRIEKYAGR